MKLLKVFMVITELHSVTRSIAGRKRGLRQCCGGIEAITYTASPYTPPSESRGQLRQTKGLDGPSVLSWHQAREDSATKIRRQSSKITGFLRGTDPESSEGQRRWIAR